MKTLFHKSWCVLLLTLTFLVSCSDDDSTIETNSPEVNAALAQEVIGIWNDLWIDADRYAAGMRPTATARSLAYIHLAAYETGIPQMQGYLSNASRLDELTIDSSEYTSEVNIALALNSCYARVMDYFMYTLSEEISSGMTVLENANDIELEVGLTTSEINASKNWGRYVADQVIAYSQTDTAALGQINDPQPLSYVPEEGEGYWTFSADPERALFPYWESVRTFVISPEETSTVPPLVYSNEVGTDYYAEMMETYTLNNEAREQDNENLWIAEFWSDDVEGLMISPPGRQFSIARQLTQHYSLGYEETLFLYLKLGFALNDAAVSTWADKYHHMVMRPSVFIKDYIDPDYQTNLYRFIDWPNPSFPGYPSGHSAFASSAAGVFIGQFGDATDFTDRTHAGRTEFRGSPRQFTSFSQMASENGYSRIPLGVHIRMDCDEGLRLGYEVSDAVNTLDLIQ